MINLGWSLLDFTRWYKFLSILRLKCRQEKSKKFLKNANFLQSCGSAFRTFVFSDFSEYTYKKHFIWKWKLNFVNWSFQSLLANFRRFLPPGSAYAFSMRIRILQNDSTHASGSATLLQIIYKRLSPNRPSNAFFYLFSSLTTSGSRSEMMILLSGSWRKFRCLIISATSTPHSWHLAQET